MRPIQVFLAAVVVGIQATQALAFDEIQIQRNTIGRSCSLAIQLSDPVWKVKHPGDNGVNQICSCVVDAVMLRGFGEGHMEPSFLPSSRILNKDGHELMTRQLERCIHIHFKDDGPTLRYSKPSQQKDW